MAPEGVVVGEPSEGTQARGGGALKGQLRTAPGEHSRGISTHSVKYFKRCLGKCWGKKHGIGGRNKSESEMEEMTEEGRQTHAKSKSVQLVGGHRL